VRGVESFLESDQDVDNPIDSLVDVLEPSVHPFLEELQIGLRCWVSDRPQESGEKVYPPLPAVKSTRG
jgi:hypothetical protein